MPWSRPCVFSNSRASSMIWPMSDLCEDRRVDGVKLGILIGHCVQLHRHRLVLAEDDVVRPAEVDRVVVDALAGHELRDLADDLAPVVVGDGVLAVGLHPRLEVVHVERRERGALLLGELDEAVLARAAAAGAARALARALVVRPLVVRQALGPGRPALEARRAAALALGHLLAGQARLRRRLLLVLLHVTPAVRVDADGQHEGLVALDALVALDLVLGLGGDGDVRRHVDR